VREVLVGEDATQHVKKKGGLLEGEIGGHKQKDPLGLIS